MLSLYPRFVAPYPWRMERRRGKPRATSHDEVHAVALELFRTVGFAETTMTMIADSAGVGRSTLFRYFSSRADILWYGYVERTEEFRLALATRSLDLDLVDSAFDAYRSLWSAMPERTAVGKEVTLILETGRQEDTGRWRVYQAWSELVHDFVLERTGRGDDDVAARAAAMAIWASIWTAVVAFAHSDAASIDGHLAIARAAIEVRL